MKNRFLINGLVIGSFLFAVSQSAFSRGRGNDTDFGMQASNSESKTPAPVKNSSPTPGAPAPVVFDGVGVAVIDTGVSLRGSITPASIAPGSKSFIGKNPLADSASGAGHGTPIAQIIRSTAPSSKILSIQTGWGSSAATAKGIQYAASNPSVRVINHSNAGLVRTPGPVIIQTAINDQVLVMQAGNQGRSSPIGDARHAPGLGGTALVVGGLGPGGTIYVMSNQAGDLAQHYVVAAASSKFAKGIGTSFATPRVSGIAAKLRETWPDLSAQEVVSIIKRSAVDMGKPGVDNVYGWGRASPTRAFMPLGPVTSSPKPKSTADQKTPPEEQAVSYDFKRLEVGAPIYSLVLSHPEDFGAMVFDQFNRDFYFDLSKKITRSGDSVSLKQVFYRWSQTPTERAIGDYLGFRIFNYATSASPGEDQAPVLLMRSTANSANPMQLGYGIYPESYEGAKAYLAANDFGGGPSTAWRQTALGHYRSDGLHSLAAFEITPDIVMEARYSDVADTGGLDYDSQELALSSHLSMGESGVSLEGGWLAEKGSMFGGAPGGPLSLESAETRFIRLSGFHPLGEQVALVASVTGALTQVNDKSGTVLRNYSEIISDGWLAGLHLKSVVRPRDAISLTIAQPLRVRSGEADLDIAYGFDSARQILRTQQRLNLEPSGSETLVELGYRTPWGKSWNIGGFLTFRSNPDHVAQSPARTEVMAVAQTRF